MKNKAKSGIIQLASPSRSKRKLYPKIIEKFYGIPVLYKYLGIWTNFRIHLEDHLNELRKKTNKLTFFINCLGKRHFDVDTLIKFIKIYIIR